MSIDWSKPLQTRDGREVKLVSREGMQPCPVIGYVKNKYDWDLYTWRFDGTRVAGTDSSDLINVPEPKVLGVLNCHNDTVLSYTSRKLANNNRVLGNCTHIVTIYRQPNGDVTAEVEPCKSA